MYAHVFRVRNVNEALPRALQALQHDGAYVDTRNGPARRLPGPVVTVYSHSEERVLFGPKRDANPFFHLMDALWMLSGSNRVDLPAAFLPRIKDYSDDGNFFHGAYGFRLRYLHGFDQIARACDILSRDPSSRQVVLSIWDPRLDMGHRTKDLPCNDMVMADITEGALNITVCNRSNDAVWGAYGANAVQFSMLQEYMAAQLEVRVGTYVQVSNNFHVYEGNAYWQQFLAGNGDDTLVSNPYLDDTAPMVAPLASNPADATLLFRDCVYLAHHVETQGLLGVVAVDYQSSFFKSVVVPVLEAWLVRANNEPLEAMLPPLQRVASWDWRAAMLGWVQRRIEKQGATK